MSYPTPWIYKNEGIYDANGKFIMFAHRELADTIIPKVNSHAALMDAIESIHQTVDTELGDWKAVEIDYCPIGLHGYKEIQYIIDGLDKG